jgi:hypothetical protein
MVSGAPTRRSCRPGQKVPLTCTQSLQKRSSSSRTSIARSAAFVFTLVMLSNLAMPSALARNYPCSGSKGGISHCQGKTFICNDGSVSGSKKYCSAPQGNGNTSAAQLFSNNRNMTPSVKKDTGCRCRSGNYCTGPRGGQFCYSDSGRKSYLRK